MGFRGQSIEGTPPTLKKERLLSIIEYAQQSARMRQSPTATVAQHQIFAFHEHQAQDLPGIHFNCARPDDEDELWFSVERLRETKSPEADNRWLCPWLAVSSNPAEEPKLRRSQNGVNCIVPINSGRKTHFVREWKKPKVLNRSEELIAQFIVSFALVTYKHVVRLR